MLLAGAGAGCELGSLPNPVAPSAVPIEFAAFFAGDARPVVSELRKLAFGSGLSEGTHRLGPIRRVRSPVRRKGKTFLLTPFRGVFFRLGIFFFRGLGCFFLRRLVRTVTGCHSDIA